MTFVSASIYNKATQLALKEGLPLDHLKLHRESAPLRNGDTYIPMTLLLEAYELADEHLEKGFGVRQGMQLSSNDYGTLGLSLRTCWRAKDILDRVVRFMVLVTDHGEAGIEEKDGNTKFKLMRPAHRVGLAIANEATFVMLNGILQEVTGKEISPVRVSFEHTSEAMAAFQAFFKCPVQFGADQNILEFRTSDIDIPTIKADKQLHQFMVERLDEERKGIRATADRFLSEIHQLIKEQLPSGIPSVIQVSEHLAISSRTLKRRLSEKGMTFRELVQKIQRDLSIELLRETSLTMGEIAFKTGFSEQSAFNRAFKRWTGRAPSNFRHSS